MDTYVDREQSELRDDEELMMLKVNSEEAPEDDEYDWEPAITLTHSIQRGLDHPRRCSSLYINSKLPEISGAISRFASDDKLVIGLSVDDSEDKEETLEFSKALLRKIIHVFDCSPGFIMFEEPPPDDEKSFKMKISSEYSLYSLGAS